MSTYAFASEAPAVILVDSNGLDIFTGVQSVAPNQVPLLDRVVLIDTNGTYIFG